MKLDYKKIKATLLRRLSRADNLPRPSIVTRARQCNLIRAMLACAMLICALPAASPAARAQQCALATPGFAQMQAARIALINDGQSRVEFDALIADEPIEQASGYQYICPRVIARTTILFRYDAPTAGRFHMRNVNAPLDIGFFDAGGALLQTMVMQPYEDGAEILYAPMQKFQYALETRRGFFAEHALSAGNSRLLIETLP